MIKLLRRFYRYSESSFCLRQNVLLLVLRWLTTCRCCCCSDIESKRQMDTKGGDNSVSVECEKKAGGGGGATETSVNHVEQEADKEEDVS